MLSVGCSVPEAAWLIPEICQRLSYAPVEASCSPQGQTGPLTKHSKPLHKGNGSGSPEAALIAVPGPPSLSHSAESRSAHTHSNKSKTTLTCCCAAGRCVCPLDRFMPGWLILGLLLFCFDSLNFLLHSFQLLIWKVDCYTTFYLETISDLQKSKNKNTQKPTHTLHPGSPVNIL